MPDTELDAAMTRRPRIAVIGGGISGLAAALRLRERAPTAEIVLIEQSDRLGGKLRTGRIATVDGAGMPVELGAENFLVRDPATGGDSAAVRLARQVGLGADLVHPALGRAAVAVDGALRPLPGGTLMGVPGRLDLLGDVAKPVPGRDRDGGRPLLARGQDVAVGELVRARFGDEVVDRLVEPLLGGVYAGRADLLSLVATMPGLAAACTTEHTLTQAVRAALAASAAHAPSAAHAGHTPSAALDTHTPTAADAGHGPSAAHAADAASAVDGASAADGGHSAAQTAGSGPARPIFATVSGGIQRLVDAVAAALRQGGVHVRLGLPVRELGRTATGWTLAVGAAPRPETLHADAVVLALPARPAARLLAAPAPRLAAEVGVLDYASVALVMLALPAVRLPELSGFLVPATEPGPGGHGYAIKAATFFSRKWAQLRRDDGTVLVRASVGRYRDEQALQRDDADLVALVRAELSTLLRQPLPAPVDSVVRRWGGSLPQYAPGHADRVARVRAALPGALALAGAGYDGIGIPACVRSGQTAAEEIVTALGEWWA